MKKIIFTIIALAFLASSGNTQGKNHIKGSSSEFRKFSEKFNILTTENLSIRMTYVRGYKIRKDVPWKSLMTDFLEDYKSVSTSVPAYEDFEIYYKQNESLVVEEIKGLKVFTIASDTSAMVKTNICRLQGRVVAIEIEVSDLDDVLSTDYIDIIEKAIRDYKAAPYLLSNSTIYYNVKTQETTRRNKARHKLFYDAGFNAGFLKSLPYLDIYGRISYTYDRKNYLYLKGSGILSSDLETRNTQWWPMPIVGYEYIVQGNDYFTGYGFEVGFTPNAYTPFDTPLYKLGFSVNINDTNKIDINVFGDDESLFYGFSFSGINLSTTSRF